MAQESKILVVWLERLEDRTHLPLDDLISETSTGLEGSSGGHVVTAAKDAFVIFVQPLDNGLLTVRMQGPSTKYGNNTSFEHRFFLKCKKK